MHIEDIQQLWQTHSANLERQLTLNERILQELLLRQVRSAFVSFKIGQLLLIIIGIFTMMISMSVLLNHHTEARYLVIAGAVPAMLAWVIGLSVYSLIQASQLNYAQPIAVLQRAVEQIRMTEYRSTKWALLLGVIAWLPLALIAFELATGVAALAQANLAWLIANVIFGLGFLGMGQWLSRKYLERPDLSPRARGLLESLSGRAVQQAKQQLDEIARFERSE